MGHAGSQGGARRRGVIVLGLVSSKKAALESAGELKARIAEAARIVPLERLALSAQCGFATKLFARG